jgi:hypothetical protein
MPTYERLDTIEGRVECLLQWAEEQSAGKHFDMSAGIPWFDSPEKWRRGNGDGMIKAYLRGFTSLARAKQRGRMSPEQCARFRTVVEAESEMLAALEARGFRRVSEIRVAAVRPGA